MLVITGIFSPGQHAPNRFEPGALRDAYLQSCQALSVPHHCIASLTLALHCLIRCLRTSVLYCFSQCNTAADKARQRSIQPQFFEHITRNALAS